MTRCCACCRMPGSPAAVHFAQVDGLAVIFGICRRCSRANARLPASTRQKRLNVAAKLAATDTTDRFYTARFPDQGAAQLAAGMLSATTTTEDTLEALGWI